MRGLVLLFSVPVLSLILFAQNPQQNAVQDYRIGRDDLIEITVFEVPELGVTTRVSASGIVTLPLAGAINVTGHTPEELARIIEDELRKNFLKDPHVTVLVREYGSQPVSVLGAVKAPGIYQIKGQKFLLDMLALAQGLDATAGTTIQVMRRHTSEGTTAAQNGNTETIAIGVEDLFQNGKTGLNIPIYAGDVINVLSAQSIFVVGEVTRPGEFTLKFGKPVTVAQAVALGGGFTKDAKKSLGTIIRYHKDGTKEEVPVNVEKVLDGSADDVPMMANDILFVPANKVKTGLTRALDSALSIAVGRAIYVR